jgi:hypothetical protein
MGFLDTSNWQGLIGGVKVNVEGSTSTQSTYSPVVTYNPVTTDARSVAINLGSGYATASSTPNVTNTPTITSSPSQSATQQSPTTDKMATYVLIGSAVAVALIIFTGERKKQNENSNKKNFSSCPRCSWIFWI